MISVLLLSGIVPIPHPSASLCHHAGRVIVRHIPVNRVLACRTGRGMPEETQPGWRYWGRFDPAQVIGN